MVVPIDNLIPNTWNPNRMGKSAYAKLKANIKKDPAALHVVVRKHPSKKGKWEIIDGYHRWRIAKDLGYDQIEIRVLNVDDAQAKLLTHNLNYLHGEADPDKLDGMVVGFVNDFGLDVALELLPYTSVEIEDMMANAAIDLEKFLKKADRDGKKAIKNAAVKIYKLEFGPYDADDYIGVKDVIKRVSKALQCNETDAVLAVFIYSGERVSDVQKEVGSGVNGERSESAQTQKRDARREGRSSKTRADLSSTGKKNEDRDDDSRIVRDTRDRARDSQRISRHVAKADKARNRKGVSGIREDDKPVQAGVPSG